MTTPSTRQIYLTVLVAALGYFVDAFDIVLFSAVRVESLKALGLTDDQILSSGVMLLNMQLVGMLVGGLFWGIWGDRYGRVQVLFGSIMLYSLATLTNAFVTNVSQYALLRFISGLGLAGEVGAGITLVSELLPKETRGYGTTIVAAIGVSGGGTAGLVGALVSWQTAYIIGGLMGLALLVLRMSVAESRLFESMCERKETVRGSLRMLLGSRARCMRFFSCIVVGMPIWFVVGIIVTFSPEVGAVLGVAQPIKGSIAVIYYSAGYAAGDILSGLVSQWLRSRRKALFYFLLLALGCSLLILNSHGISAASFYASLVPLGLFIGYWAVLLTVSAEQFGTNLRATAATSIPNFVRATAVVVTIGFNLLKGALGVLAAAQSIGLAVFLLAFLALSKIPETFGRDLDFVE